MPREFDPAEPEWMDRPQPVSAALERDLENLASLNRWFGSHRLLRKFLRRWWRRGDSPRVLDLCTGAGDLPLVMAQFGRTHGLTPRITALDANPATLEIARRRCAGFPEIEFIEGNALTFEPATSQAPDTAASTPAASTAPAPDTAHPSLPYDLVHCSLALHHFSEPDAIHLLRRYRPMGTRVLVSDLERAWFTTLGVWLLTALFYRDPMTKYDGRVSARRAFSFREFRALAEGAGWQNVRHERFAFCRQAMWVE
jgi:SAM-dependent methyltransferase